MIAGLLHVGLSVTDLDRSIEFYRDMLGMDLVVRNTFGGEQYAALMGLAVAKGKLALLKRGEVRLELFEFERPEPERRNPSPPVSDHGISHFCLSVTAIDAMHERLLAAGVRFHCPPMLFFGTTKATYGRDPDGNVFELIEVVDPTAERARASAAGSDPQPSRFT